MLTLLHACTQDPERAASSHHPGSCSHDRCVGGGAAGNRAVLPSGVAHRSTRLPPCRGVLAVLHHCTKHPGADLLLGRFRLQRTGHISTCWFPVLGHDVAHGGICMHRCAPHRPGSRGHAWRLTSPALSHALHRSRHHSCITGQLPASWQGGRPPPQSHAGQMDEHGFRRVARGGSFSHLPLAPASRTAR
jgi:hypothetical protein